MINPFSIPGYTSLFYYLSFKFYEERRSWGGWYSHYHQEYWFGDCWFDKEMKEFGLSDMLVSVFMAQMLTLTAGVACAY
jgi:hypothetical protein